jgi:hypothetical protein
MEPARVLEANYDSDDLSDTEEMQISEHDFEERKARFNLKDALKI